MNRRAVLVFLASTMLPVHPCFSQSLITNDDVTASQRSCRIVELTLAARQRERSSADELPPDDDFTAAGKACGRLQTAVESADQQRIQSAVADLRPMFARLALDPATPSEQLAALETKAVGFKGEDLFDELPELAKRAFEAGEIGKAQKYAEQLLNMAPDYRQNWNYGNAIFQGNAILGRVAVQQGKLEQAGRYLLAAGATPGSPQLDSFGPNMTLASDLIQKGETKVVLQFLQMCKRFWEMDGGRLDQWSAEVRQGKLPGFDSNLNY